MSSAVMYLTSPISATFCLTSSVKAVGEKTARAPDCRRTIVPRPPTLIRPNREKGIEKVVMVFGITSRMTMTFDGSNGTSLDVMMEDSYVCEVKVL
jgi:hypothetical protein